MCRHEPLGDGRRKVVWTEPAGDDSSNRWRFTERERCPWRRCPQRADDENSRRRTNEPV